MNERRQQEAGCGETWDRPERRRKLCQGCQLPTTRRYRDLALCDNCQIECVLLNKLHALPSETAKDLRPISTWPAVRQRLKLTAFVLAGCGMFYVGAVLGAMFLHWLYGMAAQ